MDTTIPDESSDPVRDGLAAAARAIRFVNHDGTPPRYPVDLYERVGELSDLFGKVEQCTRRLHDEAVALTDRPMTHDDGGDPDETARAAALALHLALQTVRQTQSDIDGAHAALSHLGGPS